VISFAYVTRPVEVLAVQKLAKNIILNLTVIQLIRPTAQYSNSCMTVDCGCVHVKPVLNVENKSFLCHFVLK